MDKKGYNIGVVTKYIENFYFGALLKGVQSGVREENARLFVFNTYMMNKFDINIKEEEDCFAISFNKIDGWIIFSSGVNDEYTKKIVETGKPVVFIGCKGGYDSCTVVLDDSYYGAQQVVKHLLSHGHKRIAYLGSNSVYDLAVRFDGYKNILEEQGFFDESIVYDVELPMPEHGKATVGDMIKKGMNFTAVFTGNDYLAFGLIEGFREAGISVPEDIAVIGYDNSAKSKIFIPALSSMNQNTLEIGKESARTIFKLIEGEDLRGQTVLVKSDLVVRESCGCGMKSEKDKNELANIINLKKNVIERLENVLYKNSDIGTKFFTVGISEIIKLIPEMLEDYSWFCLGLFKYHEENSYNNKIIINTVIDKTKKVKNDIALECDVKNFPPLQLMPDYQLGKEDVVFVVPISTQRKNLGVMSYISQIHEETTLFIYDIHMVIYNLLGISIDKNIAMTELKDALETLQNKQNQLIEAEKLVSLESLVSGVSREIRGPIEIGLNATTDMQSNGTRLKELFEDNKLTKSELTEILDKNNELVKMLLMNLQQASYLIKSFKQIAVDNTIDEKRVFNVKEYVKDVILSISPKLRKSDINVKLDCPEDLELYCNPGQLSQIFTNLIMNSINHGYDEGDKGEISIRFEKREKDIFIEYKDDGKGMEKDVFDRIFEPFFTTRKGIDGSGLGLTVVSNIVKQQFGGTIECESEHKKGTKFAICLAL